MRAALLGGVDVHRLAHLPRVEEVCVLRTHHRLPPGVWARVRVRGRVRGRGRVRVRAGVGGGVRVRVRVGVRDGARGYWVKG